ncbi:MAG: hypothetical protein ACK4JB_02125 [Reyranella sp.]
MQALANRQARKANLIIPLLAGGYSGGIGWAVPAVDLVGKGSLLPPSTHLTPVEALIEFVDNVSFSNNDPTLNVSTNGQSTTSSAADSGCPE